jgi:hypothetical protein
MYFYVYRCNHEHDLAKYPLGATQGPEPRTGYAFNAFGAETYGALGDNAKNLIRDLTVQEARANSRPPTNLYNWSASKFTESVKHLVSISLRRGIATQLRKAALARRNLER